MSSTEKQAMDIVEELPAQGPPQAVETAVEQVAQPTPEAPKGRGARFWICFLAICISLLLSALDLASVSTVLPTVVGELGGTDSFAWVSAAYTLSSTAILPLFGRLADVFGRRNVLFVALIFFGVGSAVCGSAHSMNTLIGGRVLQGVGSGGIQTLATIVVADLVTLKERGFFQSITGATFSFATAIGPFIGGALAQHASWRWLFYLNLPLCGIACVLVLFFLKLKKPPAVSAKERILSLDWIGNTIITGSTVACILALTWAGVKFPWSSPEVLAPLIVGSCGLAFALVYEALWATHPTIPYSIISNRTSISGYLQAMFHNLVIGAATFYLPAYFQAVKLAPPLLSGLYIFPSAIGISPSAIFQGIFISKTGKYRLIGLIGWALAILGTGLFLLMDVNTSVGETVPFQLIAAIGFGFIYATTFTVLAPLEPTQNAPALAFLQFVRTFSISWSISIGATIIQNELHDRLPSDFLAQYPANQDLTYSIIPHIHELPQPLQDQVRSAFVESLRTMWKVLLAFGAAGLLCGLFQKEIPLHSKKDDKFGLEEKTKKEDKEKAVTVELKTKEKEKGIDDSYSVGVSSKSTTAS